jgi:hypothetical protein
MLKPFCQGLKGQDNGAQGASPGIGRVNDSSGLKVREKSRIGGEIPAPIQRA